MTPPDQERAAQEQIWYETLRGLLIAASFLMVFLIGALVGMGVR